MSELRVIRHEFDFALFNVEKPISGEHIMVFEGGVGMLMPRAVALCNSIRGDNKIAPVLAYDCTFFLSRDDRLACVSSYGVYIEAGPCEEAP